MDAAVTVRVRSQAEVSLARRGRRAIALGACSSEGEWRTATRRPFNVLWVAVLCVTVRGAYMRA